MENTKNIIYPSYQKKEVQSTCGGEATLVELRWCQLNTTMMKYKGGDGAEASTLQHWSPFGSRSKNIKKLGVYPRYSLIYRGWRHLHIQAHSERAQG